MSKWHQELQRMPPHIAQRKRYYSLRRWQKLRARILKSKPMCCICHRVPADSVDHIQHLPDNSTFWNVDNLRPVCRPCNNRLRHNSSGGSLQRQVGVLHTERGGKETDTARSNPDPITEIFNRAKEARNA